MDRNSLQKLDYRKLQQLAKMHKLSARGKHSDIVDRLLKKFYPGSVPTDLERVQQLESLHVEAKVQQPCPLIQQEVHVPFNSTSRRIEEPVNAQDLSASPQVGKLGPADFHCSVRYQNRSPAMGSTSSSSQADERTRVSDDRKVLGAAAQSRPQVFFPPTSAELARAKARAKEGILLQPFGGKPWVPVFRPPTPNVRPKPKDQCRPPTDGRDGRDQQLQDPEDVAPKAALARPTARQLEAELIILEATSGNRRDIRAEIESLRQTLAIVRAKEDWIEQQGKVVRHLRHAIDEHYVGVLEGNPHVYGEEVEG
ncbi:hypothetical protein C8Q80DRAFT_491993 [Daedaleopsis nitida]|nr:hypothetical protein C8Q80DRAFT_491993 [Daedaleopsis nitida]